MAPRRCLHRLLRRSRSPRGGPPDEGRGAEDESGRSQHTGCQVGVEHLAALASFEARFASAEADGRNRSRSSSLGATQVAVSFHPKAVRQTRGLCLLPRGERVLCAACVRIPGPNASITGAPANQRIDSRALRPCGRRATVPLTADVNTDDLLPRDLHRSNLDFAVSPPGHPERHPDSRCARATPKGYLHASDDTPAPREAPQRSRHTNRRPIGQRPPAAPPVTDSPP